MQAHVVATRVVVAATGMGPSPKHSSTIVDGVRVLLSGCRDRVKPVVELSTIFRGSPRTEPSRRTWPCHHPEGQRLRRQLMAPAQLSPPPLLYGRTPGHVQPPRPLFPRDLHCAAVRGKQRPHRPLAAFPLFLALPPGAATRLRLPLVPHGLGPKQNANMMSLLGLSKQWKELVGKAKAKQLKPDEYTGGTFTITNLGMFGESCSLRRIAAFFFEDNFSSTGGGLFLS